MSTHPDNNRVVAYETQARYAAGEAWITLDVSVCRHTALDEALFRRDPWGCAPSELRVRAITVRRGYPA